MDILVSSSGDFLDVSMMIAMERPDDHPMRCQETMAKDSTLPAPASIAA
jgi:hypothetical protein